MPVDYVHLRVHSEYSVEDSLITPRTLATSVSALGMPAVAITDINNCYAMLKFYQSAHEHGIKALLGCEVRIPNTRGLGDDERYRYSELILLAMNQRGYHNLFKLISKTWHVVKEESAYPRMLREWLVPETTEGLIALSGGRYGDIGIALANQPQAAQGCLDGWLEIFGDRFYIEIQRLGHLGEQDYIKGALDLAASANCPIVATNTTCFIKQSDYDVHEARVCVSASRVLGEEGQSKYTQQQYLKSASEMCTLFADLPEALQNSVEIAKRCNVHIDLDKHHLPHYPSLGETQSEEDLLKIEAESGLQKRLQSKSTTISDETYSTRLAHELGVINRAGFAGYFLVVMDFVRWALDKEIPVGPGRGSGAGSVVAWALNITDVDPLHYGLLFERFLNPERVGLPDFDIDFCQDRRDEVMTYVRKHYGEDKVAGIITFNRMAGKAAVRDATRVQGKAYAVGDRLSRAMPSVPGMSMQDMLDAEGGKGALTELTELLATDQEAREVWQLAKAMEGLVRSVGRHAGGIVIAPDKLTRYAPLYYQHDSDFGATHYDKDDIEKVGLVKFDFLGLRTLTVIDKAVRAINRAHEDMPEPLDIGDIHLDDAAVYALLTQAKTVALFQLESEGMRDLLLRYKPTRFEDLIVLISLYRPGPLEMGMHTDYVERRSGRKKVDYYNVPALQPVLNETYGVFLYQEQVMESAQVLANYSLGEADILRRAMGKKKREEMAEQRAKFVEGASKNDLNEKIANAVFDVMEKFSGYGFNKSHAAAYALIAYRTAWLKTHYPPWFMVAEMSTVMNHTDSVEKLARECKKLGMAVLSPNINSSHLEFAVDENSNILYALSAIKNIGRGVAQEICDERETQGVYKNLLDFCLRLSKRGTLCNQAMLEALICAGCFDIFDNSRAALVAQVERVLSIAEHRQNMSNNGTSDMFAANGNSSSDNSNDYADELAYVLDVGQGKHWNAVDKLKRERGALGFYLSGHPLHSYRNFLQRNQCVPIKNLKDYTGDKSIICIASSVSGIRKIRSDTMILSLSDGSGIVELRLNPSHYQQYREFAKIDKLLIVRVRVSQSEYSTADYGLSCMPVSIEEINEPPEETQGLNGREQATHKKSTARQTRQGNIVVHINSAQCTLENVRSMKALLHDAPKGQYGLRIHYLHPCAEAYLDLPEKIDLCEHLLSDLRAQWGEHAVCIES